MKKMLALLPAGLLALVGCASAPVDTTPVWQQRLPQTVVQMELSNCRLLSDEPVDYTTDRDSGDPWTERPALQTEGVPVVTLYGVEPEQVELRYVENIDYLYLYYDKMMPQIDLDYILTELDGGGLQYRLDTVYNFEFVVTTEKGTDTMIVTCSRDDL